MGKIEKVISGIEKVDVSFFDKTQKRLDNLTKPQGSLGYLEEIAKMLTAATGKENPPLEKKVIFVMAGDHGVTQEGVSAYPKEVTAQMIYNFLNGGAAVNVLARQAGAKVVVVDTGVAEKLCIPEDKRQMFKDKKVNFGTKNFSKGPAMTREEAVKSIEAGIDAFNEEFAKGIDIAATGDMGIGNTTASSAITAVITGRDISDVTGRGTGIDDKGLLRKQEIIEKAIKLNKPQADDALDVLAKVGGYEIGGIAGVILAAAEKKVPVLIDGFISGAGALLAYKLEPKVKDYILASHCSVEKGHRAVLDYMGLRPILDLDMRLGEGTGAALAMHIVSASIKILTEMATFQGAAVSEKLECHSAT